MQSEYRERRSAVMAKLGQGTAIFRSAPQAVMHNDVEYKFRQDSDFYYLTGFNEPEAVAVLAPHHAEHQFILFVRPKNLALETWTGLRVGVEAAQEQYGADIAYSIEELDEHLPKYLESADRLYYSLGRDRQFDQTVLQHWQALLATYSKRGTGPVGLDDARFILHPLRQVKREAELTLLRRAIDISAKAHLTALEIAQPGRYEYEIQAEMERLFRLEGGEGPAYPSIVASGENACILHYIENDRQMQPGDLLLIDAGCCYQYYNGDITRTFPVDGQFTPEQRLIYELVLTAQEQAIAEVKPGHTFNQVHDKATRVITEGLVDLGLLTGEIDTLIEEKAQRAFFMHGTSHWLGLDVHDAGTYKVDAEQWYTLEPGNVLTVEPGIYISPYMKPAEGQPEIDDRWRGIGVRIEDNVLVTATGNEVLTAAVPKAISALERA